MAEYTSLAMGAGTGLVVFVATVLYMRRKALTTAVKPTFQQEEIRFPEAEPVSREPELATHR